MKPVIISSVPFIILYLKFSAAIDRPIIPEEYLKDFGYLPENIEKTVHGQRSADYEDARRAAIQEFQINANINVTGELDDETLKKMNTGRCGVKNNQHHSRSKRFVLYRNRPKWKKTNLKWAFHDDLLPVRTSRQKVKTDIKKAFRLWAEGSGILTFTEDPSNPDINIRFEHTRHTVRNRKCTDFQWFVLAHAYAPTNNAMKGELHINLDFKLSQMTLLQTITHELGHVLGLNHASTNNLPYPVMYEYDQPYDPRYKLRADDIAGIQELYAGKKKKSRRHGSCPMCPSNAGEEMIPKVCENLNAVNAAFEGSDASIYILHGNTYTLFNHERLPISEGEINKKWDKVETPVDAAYTDLDADQIFFFKGNKYWRYTNNKLDDHFPRLVENDYPKKNPEEPETIDAAVKWAETDNRIYFFKGSKYYSYASAEGNKPNSVAEINLKSFDSVDAVVRFGDLLYIFQGETVNAVNSKDFEPISEYEHRKFPIKLSTLFGCKPEKPRKINKKKRTKKISRCKTNFCCILLPPCEDQVQNNS